MANLEYFGTKTKRSKFYKTVHHRCKKCPYFTKSTFFLKNHVRRHKYQHNKFNCVNTLETFSCYECRFTTNLITYFNQHIQQCHHKNNQKETKFIPRRYSCANPNCNFQTHFSLLFLKHENNCCTQNTTSTKLHCKKCPFATRSKNKLKTHRQQHIQPESKWLDCAECLYKARSRKNLALHSRRHADWDSKKWLECDHCPFRSTHAHSLKEHINVKHTSAEDAQWFECYHCHFKSRVRAALRRHIWHNHFDTRWFKCTNCDYRSKFVSNLQKHRLTKHTAKENIQWFHCDKCDYKAKLKQTLKYHVETKHTPEMVKCNKCTFRTTVEGVLEKHKRDKHRRGRGGKVVRGSEWRKCGACGGDIEKNNWSRHQREIHGDVNEISWFSCDRCTFKSKRKYALKRHQKKQH